MNRTNSRGKVSELLIVSLVFVLLVACLGEPVDTESGDEFATEDTSIDTQASVDVHASADTQVVANDAIGLDQQPMSISNSVSTNTNSASSDDSSYYHYHVTVTGEIYSFASADNFLVKQQLIDASGSNVRFDDGSIYDLDNGICVEIRGHLVENEIGSVLTASRVRFKDKNCY